MLAECTYRALWAKPERVHNYIADTWTYVITVYKSLTTTVCPVKQTIIIWPKTLQKYSSSCHNIMHMPYSTVQYTLKWPGCLQHNVWHNLRVNFKFYKALSKRSSRSSSSSLPARIKLYHTQLLPGLPVDFMHDSNQNFSKHSLNTRAEKLISFPALNVRVLCLKCLCSASICCLSLHSHLSHAQ